MTVTAAGAVGKAPTVLVKPVGDGEKAKYEKAWDLNAYRNYAPGEHVYHHFLQLANPSPGDTVIDFGCGTGRGGVMLALVGKMHVTLFDFASNCLDDWVKDALHTQSHALRFVEGDLRNEIPVSARYGFCTDVMEHLPTEDVDKVIANILKSAQHVFFQISTVDDAFGEVLGEHLHLTVKPHAWWVEKFKEHGALIHWSAETGNASLMYVSSWQDVQRLVEAGTVNTPNTVMAENIRANIKRNVRQVTPFQSQKTPVMLLGGGPSLADFEEEIIERRKQGELVVTTNGAYNWCVERGINPSAQIVVDAREFNVRFVTPTVSNCKYLLSSQCHPALFDALPADQVWLWHSAIDDGLCDELQAHYAAIGQPWFPVPGGSTVMLRAIPLLRMLGFHRMEIFGFDSCLRKGSHHAFAQPENNDERVLSVTCGGQVFDCHPWMASQAQEFMGLVGLLGDEVELNIRGDGLIRHILETGAAISNKEI